MTSYLHALERDQIRRSKLDVLADAASQWFTVRSEFVNHDGNHSWNDLAEAESRLASAVATFAQMEAE